MSRYNDNSHRRPSGSRGQDTRDAGPLNRYRKPKCAYFDPETGAQLRVCKPGCTFVHPGDKEWSTAPVSRLFDSKKTSSSASTHSERARPQEGPSRASSGWGTSSAPSHKDKGTTSSWSTTTQQPQSTWSMETSKQSTWSSEPWGQSTGSKSNQPKLTPKTKTFEDDWNDIAPVQSNPKQRTFEDDWADVNPLQPKPKTVDENRGQNNLSQPKPKQRTFEDDWADVNPLQPKPKAVDDSGFQSNMSQPKPKKRTFEDDWADVNPLQPKPKAVKDNAAQSNTSLPKPRVHSIEDPWGDINPLTASGSQQSAPRNITAHLPTTNPWLTNDNSSSSSTTVVPESASSKKSSRWPNSDKTMSAQPGGSERLTGVLPTQTFSTTIKNPTIKQTISKPAKEPSSSTTSVSSAISLNPPSASTLVPNRSSPWSIQNSSIDTPMKGARDNSGKPSLTLTMGDRPTGSVDVGHTPASAESQSYRYKLPQTPAESKRKDSISSQFHPPSSSASVAMITPINSAGPNLPLTTESRFDNKMQAQWASRIQLIRTAVDYLEERAKIQDSIDCRQNLVKRIRSKARLQPLDVIPVPNEKENELKRTEEKYQVALKELVQKTEADWLSDSPSGENWWPIPRLGISYENAVGCLEEDFLKLEEISQQETVVMMEEEPLKVEGVKEPDSLPSYTELQETIDDLRDRVRATAQLVHNQNERLPLLIRQVVRERYPSSHTPVEDTGVSVEERIEGLKDRYEGLATAAMEFNSELKELRAQRRKHEVILGQLQIEVDDTRKEQEVLAIRYKQLLQRAKGLQNTQTSQPILTEILRPRVLEERSISLLGGHLVTKLRPITEKYEAEDREYLKMIQTKISQQFESELEAQQKERAQRYEEFLNRLQTDPAIVEMDKIGATIDERWNDVISRSTTMRRPAAVIRIPETT